MHTCQPHDVRLQEIIEKIHQQARLAQNDGHNSGEMTYDHFRTCSFKAYLADLEYVCATKIVVERVDRIQACAQCAGVHVGQ